MLPAFALCCRIHILLICIRHSHPADQDPSALSILECLGCIEIKAVVPFPESFFLRLSILQDKVSGLIDVLKTELFSGQSLGRYRKHLLSLKSEKIRALPHVSECLLRSKLTVKFPVLQIFGSVKKYGALVAFLTAAKDHPVLFPLLPDLRVTDVAGVILRIILTGNCNLLCSEMKAVRTLHMKSAGLSSVIDIIIISIHLDVSCVEKMKLIFLRNGRA